jgi:NTP pyrophosphatase (non-canonical NTP hydrolase)
MEFKELTEIALAVRQQFANAETNRYGREWSREELMLGFMKDVGDLAQLLQAKEGVRQIDDVDVKLAHELSDCLWSIMVLADKYGIDLETAFVQTMDELTSHLGSKTVTRFSPATPE